MDVVPLLEKDPHGGSLLREAMACGKIALSVDGESGAQKEFMLKENSILVPSDDYIGHAAKKIIFLHENTDFLKSLGAKARSYATQEMSFEYQANLIITAYESLPS